MHCGGQGRPSGSECRLFSQSLPEPESAPATAVRWRCRHAEQWESFGEAWAGVAGMWGSCRQAVRSRVSDV